MAHIRWLNFCPHAGLSSRHLQTILPLCMRAGNPPISTSWIVDLHDGDQLSCEVSSPPEWQESDKTIVMVHGLGGSHESSYMIRMARKLFEGGKKVVRVNLRGGSDKVVVSKPYNAGTSADLLKVLQALKKDAPLSSLTVIGFSLGGNVVLKLAGELGEQAEQCVDTFIAVCPPFDIAHSVRLLEKNFIYNRYYVNSVRKQGQKWLGKKKINSLFEFDELVTAPLWSYNNATHYYESCSSARFLPEIKHNTHVLCALDDPFVSMDGLHKAALPDEVTVWATQYGGHMGYIGKTPKPHGSNWMDYLLLRWIEKDFDCSLS